MKNMTKATIATYAISIVTIVSVVTALNIGLNLVGNKMITGHYIHIWK